MNNMKTIKIIDLLNKIANGEEVPEKIKYDTKEMKYDHNKQDYLGYYSNGNGEWLFQYLFDRCRNTEHFINDEVEIIEEKKLPEKLEEIGIIDYDLGYIDYKNIEVLKTWLNSDMQTIFNELDLIVKNQNQLIDYLESKEKGE